MITIWCKFDFCSQTCNLSDAPQHKQHFVSEEGGVVDRKGGEREGEREVEADWISWLVAWTGAWVTWWCSPVMRRVCVWRGLSWQTIYHLKAADSYLSHHTDTVHQNSWFIQTGHSYCLILQVGTELGYLWNWGGTVYINPINLLHLCGFFNKVAVI